MSEGSERRSKKSKSKSSSQAPIYYRNPFFNFIHEFRQMQQNVSGKDVFRLAGERWRNMSKSDREPYISQAQIAKEEYAHSIGNQKRRHNNYPKKRKCSKCGHKHGSTIAVDSEGETTRDDGDDDDDDDDATSVSSLSRSRSPSRSKSDSKSGSLTAGDYFDDETTTSF